MALQFVATWHIVAHSNRSKVRAKVAHPSMAAKTSLADVTVAGAFVRKPSVFRNAISSSIDAVHPPAAGRYLLYVSLACPWACRCLAVRHLKGLAAAIDVAVVSPLWARTKPDASDDLHEGWMFDAAYDTAATSDPIYGAKSIREVYEKSLPPDFDTPTRFTVPVLFDKKLNRIVNNESSEIIRFLNSEFNAFSTQAQVDLYPLSLRPTIDAMNDAMYDTVNNGVYRCGFAQSQDAYDAAIGPLFETLTKLDHLLGTQRYLAGPTLTECDVRLFVTLVRFDPVYVVHFKCSARAIREFVHLPNWLRDVYQSGPDGGLGPASVNIRHITHHYFGSHKTLNPYGIIPKVPDFDLTAPHGRDTIA